MSDQVGPQLVNIRSVVVIICREKLTFRHGQNVTASDSLPEPCYP